MPRKRSVATTLNTPTTLFAGSRCIETPASPSSFSTYKFMILVSHSHMAPSSSGSGCQKPFSAPERILNLPSRVTTDFPYRRRR